jgi:hypothetical protein
MSTWNRGVGCLDFNNMAPFAGIDDKNIICAERE